VRPPRIVFEEVPSRDDLDALKNAIDAFNYETTGFRDGRYLVAFVRDDDGRMIAGLSGFTWGGYAKVEFLWIAEPQRRAGLGRRLLTAAEDEARSRGCALIVLDTHDFQAPGFYAKLGYEACGRVDGTPRGSGQTWFKKSLV
jgi:GNAT superfamily N-acetyltransferase